MLVFCKHFGTKSREMDVWERKAVLAKQRSSHEGAMRVRQGSKANQSIVGEVGLMEQMTNAIPVTDYQRISEETILVQE